MYSLGLNSVFKKKENYFPIFVFVLFLHLLGSSCRHLEINPLMNVSHDES